MSYLHSISSAGLKYDHIVGTGGIGSGMFFSLEGNHTLGRNESRIATLLPYQDFCKQHIIMHYVAILLGASLHDSFQAFPIGRVGNDEIGNTLIKKMQAAGMDTGGVNIVEDGNTLFSVCFQYPDHSGGNITTEGSASSSLSPEDIAKFFEHFSLDGTREIILSAPEVPLATRITLLEYGRERGSLNTASLLSAEVDEFKRGHGFELVDILSINMDEARSIVKMRDETAAGLTIVEACVKTLVRINPDITILITDGSNGSFTYENNYLEHIPALAVPVISTAGAGDALLAGTLAGLNCGLPLTKGTTDKYLGTSPLQSAVELGTLLASLSVTSHDTIHPTADARILYEFAQKNNIVFGTEFSTLFKGINNGL